MGYVLFVLLQAPIAAGSQIIPPITATSMEFANLKACNAARLDLEHNFPRIGTANWPRLHFGKCFEKGAEPGK
jgi:hypothetical protein